jgi:2-dehydro-3-deoxy-D-arabinonate dehydratase
VDVTDALFRVRLPSGVAWARGSIEAGPQDLLPPGCVLDDLLAKGEHGLASAFEGAAGEACPSDAPWLTPIESQEVWCSGVTYERTRHARVETTAEPSLYDHLYSAERPELFFKAPGWRVRGPGQPIAVRADSGWDMAEPELGLVLAADGAIQRQNPLYLPQAKVYDGGCAVGPAIVPDPSLTLLPGDRVRIEMDPLGVLENPVVAVG